MSVPLSAETYSRLAITKVYEADDRDACVTSLDFDDNGQFLISSLTNESIHLYDAHKGKYSKPVFSKKYGCHLAKFTHTSKNCVYASTKEDNTIRYLSLTDNVFIRYFKGHKGLVNSLEVSPVQDIFVSASLDDTVKLWDIRTSNAQAMIPSARPSYLAFDPAGLVVATASESTGKIELRDVKQFAVPFETFILPKGFKFNKIEFSNDNKYILVSSTNGDHLILDAFDGKLICQLGKVTPIPPRAWPDSGAATFTPCGKFVFAGNGDGTVSLYNLKSEPGKPLPKVLHPISSLKGDTRPRMCAFNPKYLQLITADSQLVSKNLQSSFFKSILTKIIKSMWLPDFD